MQEEPHKPYMEGPMHSTSPVIDPGMTFASVTDKISSIVLKRERTSQEGGKRSAPPLVENTNICEAGARFACPLPDLFYLALQTCS